MTLVKLHDRLFLRGHTRHVHTRSVVRTLREHQITFVLNVAIIVDENLEKLCDVSNITYWYSPMSDSRQIDEERVFALRDLVVTMMETTGVLVHCDAGKNRSSLIAVLAWAKATDRPVQELITELRTMRPTVLDNPIFEQFVLDHGDLHEANTR